jgi:hypothetical protein
VSSVHLSGFWLSNVSFSAISCNSLNVSKYPLAFFYIKELPPSAKMLHSRELTWNEVAGSFLENRGISFETRSVSLYYFNNVELLQIRNEACDISVVCHIAVGIVDLADQPFEFSGPSSNFFRELYCVIRLKFHPRLELDTDLCLPKKLPLRYLVAATINTTEARWSRRTAFFIC